MFSVNPKKLVASSSFRLALAYVALFAGSAVVLLAFIYWSTTRYMQSQTDETIETEIRVLAERYRLTGLAGLTSLIQERVRQEPPGPTIYLLVDQSYTPLTGNLSRWPRLEPDDDGWLQFPLGMEGHVARARPFRLRGDFHLLVGRDLFELEAVRTLLLRTMVWGLALTVGLALVGGLLVSRSRVRRIGAINEAIRGIVTGDLSRRIPSEPHDDDIEALVAHVNGMLDELERLVEGVRRVSDSIAHDLRTPLSRLRNELERSKAEPDGERARQSVERAIAEADGLLSTFKALLRIARIESGERRAAFTDVDLSGLIDDVAELYGPLFEEASRSFTVERDDGVRVHGDRDLLFQAVANLLDNALKYTAEDGRAALAMSLEGEGAVIEVSDDGPGIPAGERDQVLQRFYRLDESRGTPGAGLGLALVAAVAELHQAELRLRDHHPGLRVLLTLRTAPPSR